MNVADFLKQFVPILVLCLLVALGLYKIPDAMVKGFMVVGRVIQIATNLMFAWAVLGVFIPQMSYADVSSVEGALMIIFKSAIIIAGALVMSELILKVFRRQIESVAKKLGTNEVSVVCMLMNCATSLAILPLFDRMDDKGRKLNCAFSISGAYVIGGSMAFLSAVSSGYVVLIFFVCKLVSGILSLYIMHRMERKND
ncbi:MAG: ethanolamine utilization protein EutH [Firmicutes bacterium]|nr:ethanolamine utilization protein EutH [Bacillota bacterium]